MNYLQCIPHVISKQLTALHWAWGSGPHLQVLTKGLRCLKFVFILGAGVRQHGDIGAEGIHLGDWILRHVVSQCPASWSHSGHTSPTPTLRHCCRHPHLGTVTRCQYVILNKHTALSNTVSLYYKRTNRLYMNRNAEDTGGTYMTSRTYQWNLKEDVCTFKLPMHDLTALVFINPHSIQDEFLPAPGSWAHSIPHLPATQHPASSPHHSNLTIH